ncbi:glucose-fructose oxidoreductase domain-containing protein 2 [Lepeophtheirus salmonis]|uniref:glucose-fructose oxidoreductase domain-containing protein 2 n=1 Tax=Lepeophtheirus salmonis TaxID=72036 RepID=UPI001AE85CB5|nr:glucose-fructose oxidoreductase domain-containing protein 2-like isoform X2 [Lepeophtheirus salmonis]
MSGALPGVGVFGTGSITYATVPYLKNLGYRIEALWGRNREEAELTSTELGIPFFTDKIDDVLLRRDVDLVLIFCPPFHHSQIAVKALGIGKHVCVQSPGGLNQSEALRMVQAAQYYPSLYSVLIRGLRFLPCFQLMKREISDGYLGKGISLIDVRLDLRRPLNSTYSWSCDESMGGGTSSQYGSHLVDLLYFLTGGQRAQRIHGVVRTLDRTTESINGIRQISADDFSSFQMEMSNGIFANVVINGQAGTFYQEVRISGPEGYLIARNGELSGFRCGQKKEEILLSDPENDNDSIYGLHLLPRMYIDGIRLMFHHLAQSFRNGEKTVGNGGSGGFNPGVGYTSFEDALYVHAVIEAVKRSSKDKSWTKVSYVDWWK